MDSVTNGLSNGKDNMASMLKEMLKISGTVEKPRKCFTNAKLNFILD